MKTVACWDDLRPFGFEPLTGEACGLMWRILFDVTERGRKIIGKCFGVPNITLAEPWNRGTDDEPHVGSIMLTPESLVPLAVFALLEDGCPEVYYVIGGGVVGVERGDPPGTAGEVHQVYGAKHVRRFIYGGTAGDRNVHVMSGRVE